MDASVSKETEKLSQQSSNSTSRRIASRPACTHTKMIRVYGNHICQMCHQLPSLGFLYFCHQDVLQNLSSLEIEPPKIRTLQTTPAERSQSFQSLSKHLLSLGFSKSVAQAAEDGHYSAEQIQILKEQKLNVKKTIRQSLIERTFRIPNTLNAPLGNPTDDVDRDDRACGTTLPQSTALPGGNFSSASSEAARRISISKAFQPCNFRVCHTCRPPFRDRCYISFESAWEHPLIEKWIPDMMPVVPASMVKFIGLPKLQTPIYRSSSSLFETTDESSSEGELRSAKRVKLTTKPSTVGFRECLARDFQSLVADSTSESPFQEGQGNIHGRESQVEFDLYLWKSMNDAILNYATQIPLPEEEQEDEEQEDEEQEDEADVVADRLRGLEIPWATENSIPEETGTEPELVEGGVALTEEAFENNSPDIITSL